MKHILDGLNPEQKEAVTTTHGPLLVLAGAGSGKTKVLTHRVAYLVQSGAAGTSQILAVTFTNKAAGEMRQRVQRLLKQQSPMAISTFHSLGVRLLREQAHFLPRSPRFTIFDSQDSLKLIKQALEAENLSPKQWSPYRLKEQISRAKNALITSEQLLAQSGHRAEEITAKVYHRYQALLKQNDAYDFDDLIVEPLKLLEQHTDVRQMYQQHWPFISVDEYQDTNAVQDRLINLLLGVDKNICVVGDDYQTIYSWRGAQVSHILEFEERFPTCKIVLLTQNYRSTPAILHTANAIISRNRRQKHKKLWTAKEEGTAVQLRQMDSDRQEASWVRERIEQHVKEGGRLQDCAVLYRTNAQSRVLEEEFLREGVPYEIIGGFRFYDRREIKDALALLQLFVQGKNFPALQRVAASLWRGIGPKTLARWREGAERAQTEVWPILRQESQKRVQVARVLSAYEKAAKQKFTSVAELLSFLLKETGYLDYLARQIDAEERQENINELLNVAALREEVGPFLDEVALLTDLDTHQHDPNKVTCMTLHAAKGLEFSLVIIVGCEEGLIPHYNSLDSESSLEEERRLLYVGITRAREQLFLTYAQQRWVQGEISGRLPSRFFETLPDSVEYVASEYQLYG